MHRRTFLAAPLALAGCDAVNSAFNATLSSAQANEVQNLIAAAQAVETEFVGIVPALLAAVQVAPATVTAVKADLQALVTATNTLAGVQTISAGTTYVVAIASSVEALLTAAATFPGIPAPIQADLLAAAALLPAALGIVKLAIVAGTALDAAINRKALAAPAIVTTAPVIAPTVAQ